MKKKYKDFINENVSNISLEEYKLLNKYQIRDYELNPDTNRIDIFQSINLRNNDLTDLPDIRFGIVYGYFECSNNRLTSLKNCPIEVHEAFYCHSNKLTSLEYCPIKVGEKFNCSNNLLESLRYCPNDIGGSFDISNNRLTSLEDCPKIINIDFVCRNNRLSSLEDCPRYVKGNFYFGDNSLTKIEDYPLCIIKKNDNSGLFYFRKIRQLVNENEEIFKHLLDDKIKFHQMVMRLDPSLIQYYTTISPNKKYDILV